MLDEHILSKKHRWKDIYREQPNNLPETCLSRVSSTIKYTGPSLSLSFENHNHVCSINEEIIRLLSIHKKLLNPGW
jgi:hypothetical protein